jgi:hypothetical protein
LLCKEKHSDLRFFFIGLQLAKGIIFGIDPLEDREEQKVAKGGWLSNLVPASPAKDMSLGHLNHLRIMAT